MSKCAGKYLPSPPDPDRSLRRTCRRDLRATMEVLADAGLHSLVDAPVLKLDGTVIRFMVEPHSNSIRPKRDRLDNLGRAATLGWVRSPLLGSLEGQAGSVKDRGLHGRIRDPGSLPPCWTAAGPALRFHGLSFDTPVLESVDVWAASVPDLCSCHAAGKVTARL